MKKSKLLLSTLLAGGVFLTACSGNEATTTTTTVVPTTASTSTTVEEINYTLKVYDLDGSELLNKSLKTTKKDSLFVDLNRESTLVNGATDLGHYLISINDSIIDNNYFLAIYQNGNMTSTGIDGVVLSNGDEIVIKNECWKGFDETDLLVDKAFYQYINNYLIEDIKDDTIDSLHVESTYEYDGVEYTSVSNFTNFWTYAAVDVLKENGYDINIKNDNPTIYNAIKDYDLDTLTGTDFGKYYYYAKAFDVDMTAFKTKYKAFINDTLESEYTAGYSQEYSIPFEIAPAKGLKIVDTKITGLVSTDYVPPLTTEWDGVTYSNYDGYNWFQTVNLLFGKEKDTTTLNTISQLDYTKETPTTIALSIATFAASNEDVRKTEYKNNGKDLVELLLESYDPDLGLIKVYGTDTGLNYSNNQIYASLFAYKFQRDTRVISSLEPKAFNIFA